MGQSSEGVKTRLVLVPDPPHLASLSLGLSFLNSKMGALTITTSWVGGEMLGAQCGERPGAGAWGEGHASEARVRLPGGTWVGEALLVLHQGDARDGADHRGPHELQPNVQPLYRGAGGKLAPLVQLQQSLVLLLKPGRGREGREAAPPRH